MKRTVCLPLKAFSINRMSSRDARFKTKAYKEWSYQVFHYLNSADNKKSLKDLREFFQEDKHCYCLEIITYYPEDVLITQANVLSARAFDTTNIEKPLVDLIFSPQFFRNTVPYGVENLNIDDKYLLDCVSRKRIADSYSIFITLSILDRDELLERHVVNDKS